jgi:hypothetical protein
MINHGAARKRLGDVYEVLPCQFTHFPKMTHARRELKYATNPTPPMSRHAPSFFTAGFDPDSIPIILDCCALRESAAHRQILFALNRGLPHGGTVPARRTLSVLPGSQTPGGARTFTVHFHS